jgi:GntR family transcriptional regulator/MocR family aminotransferase
LASIEPLGRIPIPASSQSTPASPLLRPVASGSPLGKVVSRSAPLRHRPADHYDGAMRSSPAAVSPIIPIDRDSGVPLHKQIYDGYRSAILRGDLRPGAQITSSRTFAAELRVSRFPVLNAYAQLLAEGYFESRVGAGTFVSTSLPEQLMSAPRPVAAPAREPSGPRPVAKRAFLVPAFPAAATLPGWGAFGVHQPAFDQFPFPVWSSLVARHSNSPQASAIHHIDPRGSERFREEICNYLRTARAVKCEPGQIMIVSGSQQALDITARVLLDPGNRVWVEEPGYTLERSVIAAAGCQLCPVPVDNDGMDVAEGIRRYRKARAAFVTPSHQYPLGSTMSASRRLQLLNWAQSSGAWIVEDDYDSEFRYESQPVASLQGLDANARVIYIGTFSKVLFASLRIGYIVVPRDLLDRFMAVRFAMDIFPPYLYQEVLTDFMKMGHFGRHIRRMRQLYGERRTVLVKSLREEFGNAVEVHGAAAGMHLSITFPRGVKDREVVTKALRERLWLWALSPNYMSEAVREGFILGFGSTPTDQIPRGVARLKALVMG